MQYVYYILKIVIYNGLNTCEIDVHRGLLVKSGDVYNRNMNDNRQGKSEY